MRVLGRKTSINVQKVLWVLEELGLAHERVDLGGKFGGLQTAEYAALNPSRRVPTLEDGDLVLWESNVIVRYLARAYGDRKLTGASLADEARADIWMDWFQSNAYAAFIEMFYQSWRLPEQQRDPAQLAQALKTLTDHYKTLNERLDTQDFVAGNALTIGDVPVGSSLFRYFTLPIERPDLPALAAYYARLTQRAAYRDTVMTSYESLAG